MLLARRITKVWASTGVGVDSSLDELEEADSSLVALEEGISLVWLEEVSLLDSSVEVSSLGVVSLGATTLEAVSFSSLVEEETPLLQEESIKADKINDNLNTFFITHNDNLSL